MNEVTEQPVMETPSETDLVAAVRTVLEASNEPLTLSKIRSSLPARFRGVSLEALTETLQRQVAANVFIQYPKYRSQQDRFWDRPMRVHVAQLLRTTLEEKPLPLSEIRRKLPDYAKTQADSVLEEQLAQGLLYQHPPASSRGGPRYGVGRPDPKEALNAELSGVFARLERLGFTQQQIRQGALELLHEEEWAPTPPPAKEPSRPPKPAEAESATEQEPAAATGPTDAGEKTWRPESGPQSGTPHAHGPASVDAAAAVPAHQPATQPPRGEDNPS
jgi:hypothetical protein